MSHSHCLTFAHSFAVFQNNVLGDRKGAIGYLRHFIDKAPVDEESTREMRRILNTWES